MAKSTPTLSPAATDMLENIIAAAEDRMEQSVVTGSRLIEQATELAKGNVQAFFASAKIATAGFEAIGQEAATLIPRIEDMSSVWTKLGKSETPDEMIKLQSTYLSSTVEKFFADTAHIAESMIKLGLDVADPLTRRCETAFADMSSALLDT